MLTQIDTYQSNMYKCLIKWSCEVTKPINSFSIAKCIQQCLVTRKLESYQSKPQDAITVNISNLKMLILFYSSKCNLQSKVTCTCNNNYWWQHIKLSKICTVRSPFQWQGRHLHLCDGHQCEYHQQPSHAHQIIHGKQVADINDHQ